MPAKFAKAALIASDPTDTANSAITANSVNQPKSQ
jgi:hypothetical protein